MHRYGSLRLPYFSSQQRLSRARAAAAEEALDIEDQTANASAGRITEGFAATSDNTLYRRRNKRRGRRRS